MPNAPTLRDTKEFSINPDGKVSINQSLGPFAPVRTIDADLVFDVITVGKVGFNIECIYIDFR